MPRRRGRQDVEVFCCGILNLNAVTATASGGSAVRHSLRADENDIMWKLEIYKL